MSAFDPLRTFESGRHWQSAIPLMPMMPKLRNPAVCAISALALGCAPVAMEPAGVAPASWVPLTKEALLGSWELTRVSSQPVPRGMSLTFSADGGVRGRVTCGNLLRASFQVFPHRVTFVPITVTERGCDSPALLNAAEKTLRSPSSAYLSPDRQRLYVRGQETLEFTRANDLTERDAIKIVKESIKVGDAETGAVSALVSAGFACRPLAEGEYGRVNPEHVKQWKCWIATDRTDAGYTLAYAGLSVDPRGELIRVGTGSYPVLYRNLRIDAQGRTTVVQDPTQWKRP